MRWNDVIEFMELGEVENTMGDLVKDYVSTGTVYANKKSVRQSEFYQAHALGLRPDKTFEVRSSEYDDQEYVKYNEKIYQIIRTYEKGDITEIVCEGVVNRAAT